MDDKKKRYIPPELTPQEHLRDLTLAGTPGSLESGAGSNFNPLPGAAQSPGGDAEANIKTDIWDNLFGESK